MRYHDSRTKTEIGIGAQPWIIESTLGIHDLELALSTAGDFMDVPDTDGKVTRVRKSAIIYYSEA